MHVEFRINKQYAMQLGLESDVVIIGSAPDIYIHERLKQNKLTFRYSERLFKQGVGKLLHPHVAGRMFLYHTRYRYSRNVNMLCASAYTAADCKWILSYPNRLFKWGYFPEVKSYDVCELFNKKEHKDTWVLWAGRFLKWKNAEAAIKAAKYLKDNGYNFKLKMIGAGEQEEYLKKLVSDYGLNNDVLFPGFLPPDKVRENMESANIFLFTSDFNEGWGAVLNESMNSGCAVIASHAIGSVPFLIKHQENGLIYKNDDIPDLCQNLKYLLDNRSACNNLGLNAYNTMLQTWNARIAAERIITLSEDLLQFGECKRFEEGPCSKAESLHNNWFNPVTGSE